IVCCFGHHQCAECIEHHHRHAGGDVTAAVQFDCRCAVPASGGGTTKVMRADGTWAVPSGGGGSCPPSAFCLSQYANLAAAVTALNANGGGELWIDQSVTISSAQTIGFPTTIRCAGPGIVIGTSSTTADLLLVNAPTFYMDGCYLQFTGTPGTKTPGALLHLS